MTSRRIPFEQAVYGSFPFWNQGYAILAHSPGCRPEWLAELRQVCQRYGERPSADVRAGGIFALPLVNGPWMIVRPSEQGCDDQGRPGALGFHALFVSTADYRAAGCNPFGFAAVLQSEWNADTRVLPAGVCVVDVRSDQTEEPRSHRIAEAVARGRRVALQTDGPIDALARQVWGALPVSARKRATLATWAFGNDLRFDLVAVPRATRLTLDDSYVDIDSQEGSETQHPRTRDRFGRRARWVLFGLGAILSGVVLHFTLHRRSDTIELPSVSVQVPRAPDPAAYGNEATEPDERRRVVEALISLTQRFGVPVPNPNVEPAELMMHIAKELRYRGPLLTPDDRTRLAGEGGRNGRLALRWDESVRRYLDDRPLPDGFARGPLRWQLDTLVWSFHLDDLRTTHRTASEVVHALADALAIDVPVHSIPLAAHFPPLAAYETFLTRLPRR